MTSQYTLSKELRRLHQQLGIDPEFVRSCKMPMCREPATLVETEPDCYGRIQRLTPEAFRAWSLMKQAAANDRVVLHLVSAYRGYSYQSGLIRRKLDAGQDLQSILKVNAMPGFSEHHTGRAIDIGTGDCPPLATEFENTAACDWLVRYAIKYQFSMSYPRQNSLGINFEPWHWCFKEAGVS